MAFGHTGRKNLAGTQEKRENGTKKIINHALVSAAFTFVLSGFISVNKRGYTIL